MQIPFNATIRTLVFVSVSVMMSAAQQSHQPTPNQIKLRIVNRIPVPSEGAGILVGRPQCDEDGNIYTLSNYDAHAAIKKSNLKAEQLALFRTDSISDLSNIDFAWNFQVARDGSLYEIIFLNNTGHRYVALFDKDGKYKSSVRLDAGFEITPSYVAAFPSGTMIVAGSRPQEQNRAPFTGLFSASGVLLKEIALADDKELRQMGENNDPRVIEAGRSRGSNLAISLGDFGVAGDGNAYLMRRTSPAIFYAISPGGEVIRRFTVSAGKNKASFMPLAMHVADRKLAVLFHDSQTKDQVIKVVDLEGHQLGSYEDERVDGKLSLGLSFACFSDNPKDRFVFLGQTSDKKREFRVAEPE